MFFHYDRATRRYRTKITCGTSTLRARSVAYVPLYIYHGRFAAFKVGGGQF